MFKNETHTILSRDRIVFGGEIMMLVIPGESLTDEKNMLPAEAYAEYALGVTNANKNAATDSENKIIEKEFEAEYIRSSVNNLKPLVDKGKRYCKLLNRGEIVFSIAVEAHTKHSHYNNTEGATKNGKIKKNHILVAIKATNKRTKKYAIIDADCFKSSLDILAIEIRNLELAIESGRSYTIPALHDPLRLFLIVHLNTVL